jgi:hypothetical protein
MSYVDKFGSMVGLEADNNKKHHTSKRLAKGRFRTYTLLLATLALLLLWKKNMNH